MIVKKFGERIKELRLKQGLSQEKFALLIDMDRTYYASIESGKRNVSLRNIEKISKIDARPPLYEEFFGICSPCLQWKAAS